MKKKLILIPISYILKINSRWLIDLNIEVKAIKLLEGNMKDYVVISKLS